MPERNSGSRKPSKRRIVKWKDFEYIYGLIKAVSFLTLVHFNLRFLAHGTLTSHIETKLEQIKAISWECKIVDLNTSWSCAVFWNQSVQILAKNVMMVLIVFVDSPKAKTSSSWCSRPSRPHRVYMIHYSNAHTQRISRADGKHTGLAFILKSRDL